MEGQYFEVSGRGSTGQCGEGAACVWNPFPSLAPSLHCEIACTSLGDPAPAHDEYGVEGFVAWEWSGWILSSI